MKKIFILLLCFTFFSTQSFALTNRMGWSSTQANKWSQMKLANHPWYQRLLSEAQSGNFSHEDGIRDGMMYLITGDPAYAAAAWKHMRDKKYRGTTYNTGGGDFSSADGLRDSIGTGALLYSWIADGLSPQDKSDFQSVMDYWVSLALNDQQYVKKDVNWDPRPSDSDQIDAYYFGIVLYALAIKAENPTRSNQILNSVDHKGIPVGGLDATGINFSTWRNAIALLAQRSKGGQWAESGGGYNLTSVRYAALAIPAINNYLGVNKFPEYDDAWWNAMGQTIIDELVGSFNRPYQWGDINGGRERSVYWYYRLGLITSVAANVTDPTIKANLMWLANYGYNFALANGPSSWHSAFYNNADPYSTQIKPSGQRSINSGQNGNFGRIGRGITLWHEGPVEWTGDDSFFASEMLNYTGVDHDPEYLASFQLWRKGDWFITHPIGYYSGDTESGNWQNTVLPNANTSKWMEARAQTADQRGSNFAFHAGSYGGNPYGQDSKFLNGPPEYVHEYNAAHLFYHHADDSDTILTHYRLNTDDPRTLARYSNYRLQHKRKIDALEAAHQIIFNIPNSTVTTNDNRRTWLAPNGETAYLDSFLSVPYTSRIVNTNTATSAPDYMIASGGVTAAERKYQLRLVPTPKTGFQSYLMSLHGGSNPTVTNIEKTAGQDIDAVLVSPPTGNNDLLAVFNGSVSTLPPPTPIAIGVVPTGKDSARPSIINQLRFFQTLVQFHVTLVHNTEFFINDLDPQLNWTAQYSTNGGSSWTTIPFTVNIDTGLGKFNFTNGAGSYDFRIFKSDSPPVDEPADPGDQPDDPDVTIIVGKGITIQVINK